MKQRPPSSRSRTKSERSSDSRNSLFVSKSAFGEGSGIDHRFGSYVEWHDFGCFAKVVELGSIDAAAESRNNSSYVEVYSTVSKIEKQLGFPLIRVGMGSRITLEKNARRLISMLQSKSAAEAAKFAKRLESAPITTRWNREPFSFYKDRFPELASAEVLLIRKTLLQELQWPFDSLDSYKRKMVEALQKARLAKNIERKSDIEKQENNPYTEDVDLEKEIAKFVASVGVPMDTRADFKRVLTSLVATAMQAPEKLKAQKPLPKKAPIKFENRNRDPELAGKKIMDFLRLVYRDWLNGELSRAQLRKLDPSADRAVQNFLSRKPLPSDIKLPTKKELVDQELQQIFPGGLPNRNATRLMSAAKRRLASPKK